MNQIYNQIYTLINSLFDFSTQTALVEETAVFWTSGISLVLTLFVAFLPALLCFKLIRRFFDI